MARPALHVALALCLLTAGCSVLGPSPTRDQRAVAAVENATAAAESAGTHRYETDMRVVATVEDDTRSVSVSVDGAVDLDEREIRSTARRDDETFESYVLNWTTYRECSSPWDGYGVEERDPEYDWSRNAPLLRQLSLLESGSLYYNGTETVDGERMVVVTGEPTSKALTRYSERRSQPLFGGPRVENARLRVWLDAETDRPRRTELTFDVTANDGTANAEMTTEFTRYGDPVTVELPAEARTDQYELGCPGGD